MRIRLPVIAIGTNVLERTVRKDASGNSDAAPMLVVIAHRGASPGSSATMTLWRWRRPRRVRRR
jgi:hypothetical protein